MRLNFVVELVYCWYLVAEEQGFPPGPGISALDIWLVYLLMIVIVVAVAVAVVAQLHDVPMVVKRILLVDLVFYSANNHYLYHPEKKTV